MKSITPRGWRSSEIGHRFASGPTSYDAASHTCECIISLGSAVQRSYGEERLRISQSAVNTSRVQEGGVPLLNAHNPEDIKNVLGRIVTTWIREGALWGKIAFAATPRRAFARLFFIDTGARWPKTFAYPATRHPTRSCGYSWVKRRSHCPDGPCPLLL
jgi:hypothetical protein